ncbi:MAG: hypothetical protein JSR17_01560 [Proteobacteria bacterium]|nr:hypothetical protein [Pseudomonadota bacterium]
MYDKEFNEYKRGRRSCVCSGKISWNIHKVKKFIEDNGEILLSDKYINNKDQLLILCKSCNEKYEQSFDLYKRGFFHKKCSTKLYLNGKRIPTRKITYETRNCLQCKMDFSSPKKNRNQTCSPECRDKYKKGEGNAICSHNKMRYFCIECNGDGICWTCEERQIKKDVYCTRCHPNYIPNTIGSSKLSCNFIDLLELELGVKIQHIHYNTISKTIDGDEHRPIQWRKKAVDGFYEKNSTKIAIEFLGDIYHGHKKYWENDSLAKNYLGKLYTELYMETEKKMLRLKNIGYEVLYIWESDFKKYMREKTSTLMSYCHNFIDKLKCDNN